MAGVDSSMTPDPLDGTSRLNLCRSRSSASKIDTESLQTWRQVYFPAYVRLSAHEIALDLPPPREAVGGQAEGLNQSPPSQWLELAHQRI